MLSFKECKKELNKDRKVKLTDEQVLEVKKFIEFAAHQSVEQFKKQLQDEKSDNNVQGKQ